MAEQNSSRRRKWDQDDSSESPSKVIKTDASVDKSVDPVKAASLAAAKINAMYATKNPTNTPTTNISGTEPSSKPIHATSATSTVPQAPSINKVEFSKKIEINDLKNRYMLTRGPTQAEITEETGAEITTRGKYYPDANLATEKEPPLYLFISATSQESLDRAVNKVNELIETATVPTPGPPAHYGASNQRQDHNNKPDGNDIQHGDRNSHHSHSYSNRPPYDRPPRKFHEEDVPVDIADGPHYNLRAKIVGPQGANVKHISSVTGCRIQLRGKGSGFYEQDTGVESEEPLHIHISTPRQEMLAEAVKLAKDLILTIKEEVEKRNQQNAYNRGYHYSGYDYQGYGTEGPSASATESGEAYGYGYNQYDYYGQQQYDPSYYDQYNQYYQQQPPPPPPPPQAESHQQPTPPNGSTSIRHSTSPSPNSPPSNGSNSYNSVPPPSHY